MALAAVLAALDGLSDGIKGEYRPASDVEVAHTPSLKGKYVLDVTPVEGFGIDNVDMLKTTLGTEKTARQNAEQALSKFGDLKPADVTAKLNKLSELEAIDPNAEADKIATAKVEAAKRDLIAAHEAEVTPLKTRLDKVTGRLDGALRIQAATKAIIDQGGNPDVLLPHVLSGTKLVEEGDDFVLKVIDPKGNTRIGDAAGNPMSIDQFVGEFKAKDAFAPLFSASGTTGGGAQGGGGGGGGTTPPGGLKKSAMSLNDKADYIDKHGSDAFLNLPA